MVCLWVVKFGQWRKKWTVDSTSFLKLHNGSTESWKLSLNLFSFKLLKTNLRRVRSFCPNGLLTLKILLEFGLMKFNKCFFKVLQRSRVTNLKIKLVPLNCYWWKKTIFEDVMSDLKSCYVIKFLVVCNLLLLVIKFNKCRGDLFLIICRKDIFF